MRELGREFVGIDIVKDPIPVRPVQHYMMGGVDADISGVTPMLGLYAAGECANVGLNGGQPAGLELAAGVPRVRRGGGTCGCGVRVLGEAGRREPGRRDAEG